MTTLHTTWSTVPAPESIDQSRNPEKPGVSECCAKDRKSSQWVWTGSSETKVRTVTKRESQHSVSSTSRPKKIKHIV